MGRVVVVGSCNVDLVVEVDRMPKPGETVLGDRIRRMAGGKGANQAVAARAAGAQVAMLACVGSDDYGSAYRRRLSALGVDIEGVRIVEGEATGTAIVTVDEHAENSIVVVPGANSALVARDLAPVEQLGDGDVLLAQLEVPADAVARAVRTATARGARVVLNLAPYTTLPDDVVAAADPLVVNEQEMLALADSSVMPRSLLVTYGAAGATWDGRRTYGPSVEHPLDTTGAGDAFCGALAAALAAGAESQDALQRALDAGAEAVTRNGAQPNPELA